ncbi:HvfC/BufC N-terminal domain-containing protein [Chitinimonas koreensis]|uniref:HvfC/BufC N-terminal domain-containing protein n=1 Tax=Chitinimonas koreensis TaxID=356302 RepID=UPI0004234B74|nr:DNA-binding domain-containing protein [Chitinimonas koreensis]QNM97412.1 putative DNA-binding domain-containing protein [Chitinimonas koreensis]
MSALEALQRRVAAAIRHGDDPLADLVADSPRVPRATRLGIYADAYLLRLDEALRANYPKLHLLLGDDDFLALTRAYLAGQPSRQASIRWFGAGLDGFLAATSPYAATPALAELARFEWALGLAFDAADAPSLGIEALAAVADEAWPVLRVHFQPGFARLSLQWNAPAVWRALDADAAPPAPTREAFDWAIWRAGLQPHYRSLAGDEAALLAALQAGQPFGMACESLLAWHDEDAAPARAGALLGQWLAEGWIAALDAGT